MTDIKDHCLDIVKKTQHHSVVPNIDVQFSSRLIASSLTLSKSLEDLK